MVAIIKNSIFWLKCAWILACRRHEFINQSNRSDCGIACAATILSSFSRQIDMSILADELDRDCTGTSLKSLKTSLSKRPGLEARAVALPAESLGRMKARMILRMKNLHYVILLAYSHPGALCFDPKAGLVFFPRQAFAHSYSGYAVQCWQTDGGQINRGRVDRVDGEKLQSFFFGVAARIFLISLLLFFCYGLFLLQKQADSTSLLTVGGLILAGGSMLLFIQGIECFADQNRGNRIQRRVWRSLVRTLLAGKDLPGFRGRSELDVSRDIQRYMALMVQKSSKPYAILGAISTMLVLLSIFNPIFALLYAAMLALVTVLSNLGTILLVQPTAQMSAFGFVPLSELRSIVNPAVLKAYGTELMKWLLIGFAGLAFIVGSTTPVMLMFWVLVALQLIRTDFQATESLKSFVKLSDVLPDHVVSATDIRRPPLPSSRHITALPAPDRIGAERIIRVEDLDDLTAQLQESGLSIKEQRHICHEVVCQATLGLPESLQQRLGPTRIFGFGPEVTDSDLQHMPRQAILAEGAVVDQGMMQNIILQRSLFSCEKGDFPVFWDLRGQITPNGLSACLEEAGHSAAAVLTSNSLTVVQTSIR